jgi:hypothetical protein
MAFGFNDRQSHIEQIVIPLFLIIAIESQKATLSCHRRIVDVT